MKILITGAHGFLAKNLKIRLNEFKKYSIIDYKREDSESTLQKAVEDADFIFHLAGVNRPKDVSEFSEGNVDLTQKIAQFLKAKKQITPIVFSSSIQADLDNPYGISKLNAENILMNVKNNHPVYIYRLANIFGKWSKPNYNSAVATFCYNMAHGLPINIHDPNAVVNLIYVDDVVNEFVGLLEKYERHSSESVSTTSLDKSLPESGFLNAQPIYQVTVGELAKMIQDIKNSRETLITCPVGEGLWRALHATYLSFLKPEDFSYPVQRHADSRGVFVEFLKTKDAGQFSFFTAGLGITRGGHYHHTKTEKFLVLQGKAHYKFRHIVTNDFFELTVTAEESRVVETIPGWSHDITNVGDCELIVMLWANEIFDREKPDTIGWKV
ncbi:MAG: UDP-2-acetamido-2,6-beta-L-arabino-hexul-4-ose reductase [Pseudobdellovibrio sp.]